MTSLSNLHAFPILVAGMMPSAAYLQMVTSWSFRYWDNSLVVRMWATGKSSERKGFLWLLQDGNEWIFLVYTLQDNKNQPKIPVIKQILSFDESNSGPRAGRYTFPAGRCPGKFILRFVGNRQNGKVPREGGMSFFHIFYIFFARAGDIYLPIYKESLSKKENIGH